MIKLIIRFAVSRRIPVLVLCLAAMVFGFVRFHDMPVDAMPDISPVMVPVFAEADGMSPEEVERLVSYPIESAMNGLPGVSLVKSTSAFGLAVVYVYFKDGTDMYFARQLVGERLNQVMTQLPPKLPVPTLGPISTGLGQVFIYYLSAEPGLDSHGLEVNTYLRDLNDWVIKYQLQTVPGVAAILSIGGNVPQYQLRINPYARMKHGVGIDDISAAVRNNNRNAGGQYLNIGAEEYLLRGIGLMNGVEDLRRTPLKNHDGVPLLLEEVAEVGRGPALRRGAVTRNGTGELVSGIVLKLHGENSSKVIHNLHRKIEEIRKSLPRGVKLNAYYDQAHLVEAATRTMNNAMLQGMALVVAVLVLLLGNFRAALVVSVAIPFCAALAIIGMDSLGISANLMSLGGIAIAIGMLVDGSIVVVENIIRHLAMPENRHRPGSRVVMEAAAEVGKPIIHALALIIVVFLPVFALDGVEGKMFRPMAWASCLALAGSMLAALMVAPALSCLMLKAAPKKRRFDPLRWLEIRYRPLLTAAIKYRYVVFSLAGIAALASLLALGRLGTEFIPALEEGSIMIGVTMTPSISLDQAVSTTEALERRIMKSPAVKEVISRIGRPEAGSHPHPGNYAEKQVELKKGKPRLCAGYPNKAQLVDPIRHDLESYPGIQLNFTQPIQNAFDELLSGIRAQFAVKIYGEDLEVLRNKANEIQQAIKDVHGLVDLSVEQSLGQPQVRVTVKRDAAARLGVPASAVMELVENAVGGVNIDNIYMNTRRYEINLRLAEQFRLSPESLKNLPLHLEDKRVIPLGQVASVDTASGPLLINRENNQRRWIVQGNIEKRAMSGVVNEVRERIAAKVKLPPGYFIDFGGQFENQQRAMNRLAIIVPIVITMIFLTLCMAFGSAAHAMVVMVSIPLAMVGGVMGLLATGQYLSVPASVGFIALFGIAMQDAVVMLSDFNQLRDEGKSLPDAITEGGCIRFRSVILTTLTTLLGLAPLLFADGSGSEVQRPLAATVVFGLAGSTLLTLFVLPALYFSVESRRSGKNSPQRSSTLPIEARKADSTSQ